MESKRIPTVLRQAAPLQLVGVPDRVSPTHARLSALRRHICAEAYLVYTGEGVDSHLGGAGGEEGFRALVDGGPGGKDIVDEEEPAVLHLISPGDLEGPLHICLPLSPSPALGLSGPDPMKQAVADANATPSPHLFRQEGRLVEAPFSLPLWMKRDRNQEIELAGIKAPLGRLGHQATEMTAQRKATAVFEQEDRLPHRPLGFVQRRRPRHSEGRGLRAAGSAEMVRALLKGKRRDEWLPTAGAERVGDGTYLGPTPAADQGSSGGVERAVTHAAGRRKDKVEKRGQQLPQRRSSSS